MHTTGSLARLVQAEIVGRADLPISGVETVERAREGMLTFIRSRAFAERWASCGASAALVSRGVGVPGHDPARRALLVVPDADAAMIRVLAALAPGEHHPPPGVHPSAIVDPSARIGAGAAVGPLCVVGPGAAVGENAVLTARVTLGRDTRVGRGTVLHAGVVIQDRCSVGDGCLLHPGVIIGADGFGFLPAPEGRGVVKIPHIGTVEIGHGVEIGANSCVDRAKFGATRIGDGTKIDNLVQVGHGVQIGRACLICAQCGIAGSVVIEDGVVLAGHVGVADNVRIGAGAQVGAKAGVHKDVPPGTRAMGYPAFEAGAFAKSHAVFQRLPEIARLARALERAAGMRRGGHDAGQAGEA